MPKVDHNEEEKDSKVDGHLRRSHSSCSSRAAADGARDRKRPRGRSREQGSKGQKRRRQYSSSSASSTSSSSTSHHHRRRRSRDESSSRSSDPDSSSESSSSRRRHHRHRRHRRKEKKHRKHKDKHGRKEERSKEKKRRSKKAKKTKRSNEEDEKVDVGDRSHSGSIAVDSHNSHNNQKGVALAVLPSACSTHDPQREERRARMVPMSREQFEKEQSVVREVYDEESGRVRLVRGSGEIIERIVSRDDHQRINQRATRGDGSSFSKHIYQALQRR